MVNYYRITNKYICITSCKHKNPNTHNLSTTKNKKERNARDRKLRSASESQTQMIVDDRAHINKTWEIIISLVKLNPKTDRTQKSKKTKLSASPSKERQTMD